MKWLIVLLFVPAVATAKCRDGYVKTDVEGVCMAQPVSVTNPEWVSDEKPPSDKMPSYQREGVTIVNVPNMATEDAKADQDKLDAERDGKRKARIRIK